LEVRPSIEWNKGHALEYLLDTLGFSDSSTNVLPFYIGDDRSDEDAFKVSYMIPLIIFDCIIKQENVVLRTQEKLYSA